MQYDDILWYIAWFVQKYHDTVNEKNSDILTWAAKNVRATLPKTFSMFSNRNEMKKWNRGPQLLLNNTN